MVYCRVNIKRGPKFETRLHPSVWMIHRLSVQLGTANRSRAGGTQNFLNTTALMNSVAVAGSNQMSALSNYLCESSLHFPQNERHGSPQSPMDLSNVWPRLGYRTRVKLCFTSHECLLSCFHASWAKTDMYIEAWVAAQLHSALWICRMLVCVMVGGVMHLRCLSSHLECTWLVWSVAEHVA